MRISANGYTLIKEFEGLHLKSYLCPAGYWTIGYGHTSMAGPPKVEAGMVISRDMADQILMADLSKFETGVTNLIRVPLTQGQFDALVSFAFNCGLGALEKSTLLKRVNRGEHDRVPAEFMKWTKARGVELKGLVRRRRAETALWRGVDKVVNDQPVRKDIPDAPEPPKSMAKSREGNAALITGAAGAAAIVAEIEPAVQHGANIFNALSATLGKPVVLALLIVVLASAAIWYWRRQRLIEDGV